MQVWKEITERICNKLHELENVAPPNHNQMAERKLKPEHADSSIGKRDPVLTESIVEASIGASNHAVQLAS